MKISVVIPTFNMATTLPRAMQSALDQADEVVVMDDGSTDATEDVLFRLKHPKLRVYYQKKNRGVCVARNSAIALSDCDWFIPLDADDALDDNVIPTLRSAVNATTFAYGDWLEPDANTGQAVHKRAAPIGMINRKNVAKATFLFSRSMWQTVGGYDPDFEETGGEDWAFMLALLEHGFKGVHVDIPIYHYEPAKDGRAAKVQQHAARVLELLNTKYPGVMNAELSRGQSARLAD